jgi:hypothetical protein
MTHSQDNSTQSTQELLPNSGKTDTDTDTDITPAPSHPPADPLPNPEPATPSLDQPDPGVFRPLPVKPLPPGQSKHQNRPTSHRNGDDANRRLG